MLRIALIIIAALSAPSLLGEEYIKWISTVHDFGAFDEDTKKKTAFFRFVNTSPEPVSIISASATCGCTVPKYDSEPIAVGDTAVIEVSYDPSGRPGRFEKQVYVRTSDNPNRTKLLIRGTVIGNAETIKGRYPIEMGPLKLRVGAAMFGKANAGKTKLNYIDGYNMSADTLQPVVTYAPEWIGIESSPSTIMPGEMMSLDITFKGEQCQEWGILTDSIMIAPKQGAQSYALPVVVIVEEDFSKLTEKQLADAPIAKIEKERIELPAIPNNSTTPVTTSVSITNHGKDPLIIHRVYTQDPGLDVSINEENIRQNKSAEIRVTYDPKLQPTGIINARFTVISNDPVSPVQTIRIVGERE